MAFSCEDCGSIVGDGPRGVYKNRTSTRCNGCQSNRRGFLKCLAKWVERSCLNCETKFSSAKMRYCGADCRLAANMSVAKARRDARKHPEMDADCVRCGTHFKYMHTGADRKYCSRACQKPAAEEVRRARNAGNDNHQPPMPLAYRVFRESRWKCAACGVDTPESQRGTHALNAPEIDHVTPLSRGGTHDYENLQCLCKSCNSSKGAKLMSEWRPANDNFRCNRVAA